MEQLDIYAAIFLLNLLSDALQKLLTNGFSMDVFTARWSDKILKTNNNYFRNM